MTYHLGYPPKVPEGRIADRSRNGKITKTVRTDHEDIDLSIPRDRNGRFEPQMVKKHQRRGPDRRALNSSKDLT